MMNRRAVFSLALCISLLPACRGRDLGSAQGTAEEFLDQHYVHIDLQKAKEVTVGLAREKLEEEIRLTAGQVIDASTRRPRVHYKLLEKKEQSQRASFLYLGTIQADDAPEFTRRWLVSTRKEGDRWRVSNFAEHD
jgi:hypothetical protein